MKSSFLSLALALAAFLSAPLALAAQDVQRASPAVSRSVKETKKERKQREKEEKAREKQRAQEDAWEAATRPPDPPYPASITPEFARVAQRSVLVIDNAFNSIQKSRMEFALANQSSIQYAAALAASARNDGERQVVAILWAYAEKIPVCQDMQWQALQSVLALAVYSGNVQTCMFELRRLRAQADRTFIRNK